VTVERKTS